MADEIKTIAALLVEAANNSNGAITPQVLRDIIVSLGNIYEESNTTGWEDMFAPMLAGKTSTSPPTFTIGAFDPGGAGGSLAAYAFGAGDQIFLAFHTPHNVKPNSTAYLHVHWATDGVNTGTVNWIAEYSIAKGHSQEAFSANAIINLPSEAASSTAYMHQITEDTVGITIDEPDELVVVRVEMDATTCTDTIFGLAVDIHYQTDRNATINRSPNFYGP